MVADVELEGVKFRCYPFQNDHDRHIHQGTLFKNEAAEFAYLTNKLQGAEFFVDIGANVGAICIPVALRCKTLRKILAIEPNPVIADRLRYNIGLNNITNIEVKQVAVGEQTGVMRLWSNSPVNAGMGSFHIIGSKGRGDFKDVQVEPLLTLIQQAAMPRIDLMKIDVEGYEDRVLIPFFSQAGRAYWPKAIMIEHASRALWTEDCVEYMISKGYRVEASNEINTMLTH